MNKQLAGQDISVDSEGYLLDLSQWTRDVGEEIAKEEGIAMTDELAKGFVLLWALLATAVTVLAAASPGPPAARQGGCRAGGTSSRARHHGSRQVRPQKIYTAPTCPGTPRILDAKGLWY